MNSVPVPKPIRFHLRWFWVLLGFVDLTMATAHGSHPLVMVQAADLPFIPQTRTIKNHAFHKDLRYRDHPLNDDVDSGGKERSDRTQNRCIGLEGF